MSDNSSMKRNAYIDIVLFALSNKNILISECSAFSSRNSCSYFRAFWYIVAADMPFSRLLVSMYHHVIRVEELRRRRVVVRTEERLKQAFYLRVVTNGCWKISNLKVGTYTTEMFPSFGSLYRGYKPEQSRKIS